MDNINEDKLLRNFQIIFLLLIDIIRVENFLLFENANHGDIGRNFKTIKL